MASRYRRGQLRIGERFQHFGILKTSFIGEIVDTVSIKPKRPTSFHPDVQEDIPGLIITIKGSAWVTGINSVLVQDTDPFPNGYVVGDIW